MDEQVRRAMARWPDVPGCVGWMGLDARGGWWIRDAAALPWPREADGRLERRGASLVEHPGLLAFIERNYLADPHGYWFFQNGPQRVYVELEAAPLILRILHEPGGHVRLSNQVRRACVPQAAFVDIQGRLFFATSSGPGIVHTQDVASIADWFDEDLTTLRVPGWPVLALQNLPAGAIEERLWFRASPSAAAELRR